MMGPVMSSSGTPFETFRRDEEVVGPSDRSFGLLFAAVFGLIALLPLWRGAPIRGWALALSVLSAVLALAWPRALAPLNRVWLHVGLLLHRVVNPLVMGVLFYLVVTPFAVVMRRVRRELTRRLRPDPSAPSYWIPRDGPASRMDQQF